MHWGRPIHIYMTVVLSMLIPSALLSWLMHSSLPLLLNAIAIITVPQLFLFIIVLLFFKEAKKEGKLTLPYMLTLVLPLIITFSITGWVQYGLFQKAFTRGVVFQNPTVQDAASEGIFFEKGDDATPPSDRLSR